MLVASSLLAHVLPMPTSMAMAVTTTKPRLIVSSDEEPQSMVYQFIVDPTPTTMGQNYYIKPGQLLGTISLDSGTLHVKHEDSKRPISSKLNILFVANVKEQDVSTKNTLDE